MHSPPPHQGQKNPHTPPPLLSMVSSDVALWPRYGHPVISQTVRPKSRSQWSLLQFMKRLNCEEICIQKFSCFSAGRGHSVLACLLGCLKRKPGRAQSLVCSQWSTPPHPSWTQPELHHLDTVCWISKFPIVNNVIFLERALINRGALISINQANLSAPLSINQANLSAPLSSERTPLKWARPFPSIRQTWARPSQKGAPFPIYQTVSQACLLPV